MKLINLVEIIAHFISGDVNQRIVLGRAFNIAIRTGDVAKRSGIEPKRFGMGQGHAGARATVRRNGGVKKLALVRMYGLVFHDILALVR